MWRRLSLALSALRHLGPAWLLFRLGYALEQKSDWQAGRTPARPWLARPLAAWLRPGVPSDPVQYAAWRQRTDRRFFFEAPPVLSGFGVGACAEADALLAGRWRYFSHTDLNIGLPPDWHRNPLTGQCIPADQHWSRINDAGYGDIKLIWEPGRFACAYTLARAYAVTGAERYPEVFWRLVEDWAQHNPPMLGPHWRCGQEIAFRVMAWCFGLWAFAGSAHSTPERRANLVAMLAWQAERIEANLAYARSQKNNHIISEATGLWTVGLLFPELAAAERWRERGRRMLETEAARQIGPDGAYVQHSVNYHRLMLHDYLWTLRLGELNQARLSDALYERIAQATGFLFDLTDLQTGQAPNYGANDGALILPLSDCDFTDYRPVLQAAYYLAHQERLYSSGAWDEPLVWLFDQSALQAPVCERQPRPLTASGNGYFTLRGRESWGFVRCAHYTTRPSQADQLHCDLWWRGLNVAGDAGTGFYSAPAPWDNALACTDVHNTVTVDGRDQMARWGRFLWLRWAQGRTRHFKSRPRLDYYEGEHTGYRQLGVVHRRAVLRADDGWLVVDDLLGRGAHTLRLHWLLADAPFVWDAAGGRLVLKFPPGDFGVQVWCSAPAALDLARAGEAADEPTRGWRSRYYADKEPALSLVCAARTRLGARFISWLGPAAWAINRLTLDAIEVSAPGAKLSVTLAPPGAAATLRAVCLLDGEMQHQLVV